MQRIQRSRYRATLDTFVYCTSSYKSTQNISTNERRGLDIDIDVHPSIDQSLEGFLFRKTRADLRQNCRPKRGGWYKTTKRVPGVNRPYDRNSTVGVPEPTCFQHTVHSGVDLGRGVEGINHLGR